jgi:hypothetical protein
LFDDRYILIAQQLISDELKNQLTNFYMKERNTIEYKAINDEGTQIGWLQLVMERRSKNYHGHWYVLFNIAKNNPGKRLEQLMEISKN